MSEITWPLGSQSLFGAVKTVSHGDNMKQKGKKIENQ